LPFVAPASPPAAQTHLKNLCTKNDGGYYEKHEHHKAERVNIRGRSDVVRNRIKVSIKARDPYDFYLLCSDNKQAVDEGESPPWIVAAIL